MPLLCPLHTDAACDIKNLH